MPSLAPTSIAARCRAALSPPARWARAHAGVAAMLAFAAVFLSPQFVDGYACDDLLNSNIRGYLRISGMSLSQHLAHQIHGSVCAGRCYPLALALTYGVHYFASGPVAFHAFVFALVMADVAMFYGLLRLWRLTSAPACLGALFLAILFQLRLYYDPILHFAGIMPVLVGLILIAMIAFERYLATRRLAWNLASLSALAAALLTYEIAFMVAPVFVAMAHARRGGWRRALAACQAHATLLLAIVTFTLGIRCQTGWNDGSAYSPRFDWGAICQATALQASAAIPATYTLLSVHRVDNMWERRLVCTWQNWAIFAAAGALSWAYLRQFTRQTSDLDRPAARRPSLSLLAIAGGVLWILPGFLIALSPKYQTTLGVGIGYIPVLLQYFGVAMLAIGFVLWARGALPRLWPSLVWGIVAFNATVAMLTFDTNATVAMRMNTDPTQKARSLIEAACQAGLYDPAPTGATIWSVQPHPWMGGGADLAGGHFSTNLGRLVYGLIGEPTPGWLDLHLRPGCSIPPPTFVMNDLCPDTDWAYVALGAVDISAGHVTDSMPDSRHLSDSRPDAEKYFVRRFRLFLTGDYTAQAETPNQLAVAVLRRGEAGEQTIHLGHSIDLAKLEVIERSTAGILLAGAFTQPVDMSLVCVLEAKDVAGRRAAEQRLTRR